MKCSGASMLSEEHELPRIWFVVDSTADGHRAGVSKHETRVFMPNVNKGSPINCTVLCVSDTNLANKPLLRAHVNNMLPFGRTYFFFSRKTSFISFDFHLKKKNRFCLKLFDFYPFESLPDR